MISLHSWRQRTSCAYHCHLNGHHWHSHALADVLVSPRISKIYLLKYTKGSNFYSHNISKYMDITVQQPDSQFGPRYICIAIWSSDSVRFLPVEPMVTEEGITSLPWTIGQCLQLSCTSYAIEFYDQTSNCGLAIVSHCCYQLQQWPVCSLGYCCSSHLLSTIFLM